MIENYNDLRNLYYNFIKSIFITYSIKVNNGKSNSVLFAHPSSSDIKNIEYWVFYIIIAHVKPERMEELFKNLDITNIKVNNDTKEELLNSFSNLMASIKGGVLESYNNYLNNFFIIFARIDLRKEECKKIVEEISHLFPKYLTYFNIQYINTFFYDQFKKSGAQGFDINSLNGLLKEYLLDLVVNKARYRWINDKKLILNNVVNISQKINKLFVIDNNSVLSKHINDIMFFIRNGEHQKEHTVSSVLLMIPLYDIMPSDIKKEFNLAINEMLNHEWSVERMQEIFYEAAFKDIIKPDINLINKYIQATRDIIDKCKNKRISPDPIKTNLLCLADLIRFKKIDLEAIKEDIDYFRNHDDFFNFITDVENFDYNKFELEWLKNLNEQEQKRLFGVQKTKRIILEKIKNKLLKENAETSYYKELLFKYYL